MQLGGTTGGDKSLKGDTRYKSKELDGFGRGGGRQRLDRTIRNEGALELGRANGHKEDLVLDIKGDLVLDNEGELLLDETSDDKKVLGLGLSSAAKTKTTWNWTETAVIKMTWNWAGTSRDENDLELD